MEPTPWYHTTVAIILAAILLPPLGIVLLLTHRDIDSSKKVFGCTGIIVLSGLYLLLLFGRGFIVHDPSTEAHYDELDRHRAEQRAASISSQPDSAPAAESGPAPTSAHVEPAQPAAAPIPAEVSRNYWTEFRGPARDGRYQELKIRTEWPSEGLPLLWRQPVGGGYASFSVADGLAFTIEQRRRQEVVAAYDLDTGREVWTSAWDAEYVDTTGDGPRATPTWDADRIYAQGAMGDLRCLESKTGKLLWARNILSENGADNLQWGTSASPLIVADKVIVLPGGKGGKSVVAYNKLTGKPVWKVLDDQQAYTSPMLVTLAGARQILVVSAKRAMGLKPEDGGLLWDFPWVTDYGVNSAQPILLDANRFFISAGYGHGAAVVEIAKSGSGFQAKTVWSNNFMKNRFNSSVLRDGHIYGLDEGILSCISAESGQRKWKGGRYGYGQLLLAGDHLIVLTETGELALVNASPDQYVEVARFSAIEGKTWNNPAISGGRLLVRNANQMACYDIAAR